MSEKYVTAKEFDDYKKDIEKKLKKENKQSRPPREPNEYNLFMKAKIAEYKKTNSAITNKEAFTMGAQAWNKDKEAKKKEGVKEGVKA